ncbi:MAG: TonB-dependent receptor [Vicinamibacteria bacterium]
MGSRVSLQLVLACIALLAPGLGPAATAQVAPRTARPSGAPKAAAGAVKATGVLAGIITERHSAGPLPGVTVTLEETGQTVVSGADGGYRFEGVAPGTYHLTVTIESFTPARIEARVVSGSGAKVDVALEPDLHYSEVVSVGVRPKDSFEAYQPTSVLSGQDLTVKSEASLGELLKTEPGVSQRSLGPAPSRPVIRGLDGDRVLILENGQRTDDLSSQSADHGVSVNPLAATRVEVVRGPATLLYGANAIGGLVNVVSEVIPTVPSTAGHGAIQGDAGTVADDASIAADYGVGNGRWALHLGGTARRAGDVSTPLGPVDNTQSRSTLFESGASWTREKGFAGLSYQFDDSDYGIPVVEDGGITITPRRHSFGARAQTRAMTGFVTGLKTAANVRHYRHQERADGAISTVFANDTADGELLATTQPLFGRLEGTYGVSGSTRNFDARGEEALSPRVDQTGASAFTYQEAVWPHVTLQFGGRVEHQSFEPAGGLRPRDFTNVSGSTGVLVRPSDATTVTVSLARSVRNPALEELYFHGPHPGNFAFEVGNADLDAERALGIDVALRWRRPHVTGEVTWFRNRIDDYVFRRPTGEIEEELPVIEFSADKALLQGAEAHGDIEVGTRVVLEVGADYVRGELRETGEPLPRIPPLRTTIGARYRVNALQMGAQVVVTADQTRVYGDETPTEGSAVLKLYGVYSRQTKAGLHTITLRLDNAANETYRNHLSYIKDLVAEPGRALKLIYGVRF